MQRSIHETDSLQSASSAKFAWRTGDREGIEIFYMAPRRDVCLHLGDTNGDSESSCARADFVDLHKLHNIFASFASSRLADIASRFPTNRDRTPGIPSWQTHLIVKIQTS